MRVSVVHPRMAEFTPTAGVRVIDMSTGVQRYEYELKNDDLFVGVVTAGSLRGVVLAPAPRVRATARRRVIATVKRTRFCSVRRLAAGEVPAGA